MSRCQLSIACCAMTPWTLHLLEAHAWFTGDNLDWKLNLPQSWAQGPVWKISIHYWTPSYADALKFVHCCAKFVQDCAELGAQETAPNLLCLPYKNILSTFFSDFRIVSPVTCDEITLGAENSTTLMRLHQVHPQFFWHNYTTM